MALVTLKDVLKGAVEGNYAVPAFDSFDHNGTEAIIRGCEEKGVPGIIMFVPRALNRPNPDQYFRITRQLIDEAKVPMALILDHGNTYEVCMRALHYGFSGIMFDGSSLPNEENIAITKRVVEAAHACGVSVEAEIGHVGGNDEVNPDPKRRMEGNVADPSMYTKPEDAADFIARTGVDLLAVAIGSVHGVYKGTPKLDIELLKAIRAKCGATPLVMHGGSGLPEAEFKAAVSNGINKVNIFTSISFAAVNKIKETCAAREGTRLDINELNVLAQDAITEAVKEHIDFFGTKPFPCC